MKFSSNIKYSQIFKIFYYWFRVLFFHMTLLALFFTSDIFLSPFFLRNLSTSSQMRKVETDAMKINEWAHRLIRWPKVRGKWPAAPKRRSSYTHARVSLPLRVNRCPLRYEDACMAAGTFRRTTFHSWRVRDIFALHRVSCGECRSVRIQMHLSSEFQFGYHTHNQVGKAGKHKREKLSIPWDKTTQRIFQL